MTLSVPLATSHSLGERVSPLDLGNPRIPQDLQDLPTRGTSEILMKETFGCH